MFTGRAPIGRRIAPCGGEVSVPPHCPTGASRSLPPFVQFEPFEAILMISRPLLLVPGMVLLTSAAVSAVDAPGPAILGAGGGATEITPGKLQGGGRQVYIQGLIDLDALQQGNYTDGNSDLSDHRSEGWYRAELGTRIAIDSRVEVQVTIAGQGVMGNGRATENGLIYNNPSTTTNAPSNGLSGNAVIDDAFVKLKDFLGYRELAIDAGRQPVAWNMRRDHGAFLYDSRANYQTITSWDGLRAAYNLDTINFTPYLFRMPDDSQLYGITVDWEPAKSGDDRLFFTGSANLERRVLLRDGTKGDSLQTYYVGADADFTDFELFGEFTNDLLFSISVLLILVLNNYALDVS